MADLTSATLRNYAYNEGKRGLKYGMQLTQNPYNSSDDPIGFEMWVRGWMTALEEYNKERGY